MKAEEETVFLRFLTAGEMKIKSHFGQCPALTWPWFEPGPTPCVLAGGENHIILRLMSYVKTGFSLPLRNAGVRRNMERLDGRGATWW